MSGHCFGGERHRPLVCVHARADVLDVVQHEVDILEHLGGWNPRVAVQREDRYAGGGIDRGFDALTRRRLSADTVLRRKERRQSNAICLVKEIDGAPPIRRDAGVVGDETDAFSAHEVYRIAEQHFDAQPHPSLRMAGA